MKTLREGKNGAIVKSTITIIYDDNHYEIKNMGTSFYNPMSEIIEVH